MIVVDSSDSKEEEYDALEHTPAEFKSDRAFIRAAVAQDSRALAHASADLQADPDILLAAAAQNVSAQMLRDGERRMNTCKVIVAGDGRVGKTSLLRRLRGEAFREVEESTCGLASVLVDVREVGQSWLDAPDDGFEAKYAGAVVRAEAAAATPEGQLTEAPAITPASTASEWLAAVGLAYKEPKIRESLAQHDMDFASRFIPEITRGDDLDELMSFIDSELQLTEVESLRFRAGIFPLSGNPKHKFDATASSVTDLMSKARQILEERGEALTGDAPTMVVHDLAGQRMYYVLHQILLTVALTQYVVAVSLEHDLSTLLADEEDRVFGMTHGENLDFWLSSIFGRAPSAKILIVCTKLDLVDAATQERRIDALWDLFEGRAYQESIGAVVCVSSKTGEGVEEVEKMLQEAAKPYSYDESNGGSASGLQRCGNPVPLGWFRFQALAKELVSKAERWITLADCVLVAADPCEVTIEQLPRMLQEFHDIGLIIWHNTPPTRDLVVLDVQWMMDTMTALLCHRSIKQRQRKAGSQQRRLWSELQRGHLSPSLLPAVWPELAESERWSMLGYMSTLSLVCRLTEQAVPEPDWPYIVPSLLPAVQATDDAKVWVATCNPEHDHMYRIRFVHTNQEFSDEAGFLPGTLFFRVVSSLVQDATSISDAFKDLYLDRIVVCGDQRYMVRHCHRTQSLELTVFAGGQPTTYSAIARQLREFLLTIQGSFGVRFRYEVQYEHRGEPGWWSVLDLPADHELRQLWIPRIDHPKTHGADADGMEPEPEFEPDPEPELSTVKTSQPAAATTQAVVIASLSGF